jgi:hypothetical protein
MLRVIGAAVLGFVIGAGWQYTRAEQARSRADSAGRALEAARLEATLGAAVIETHDGRYEIGRQLASLFFTDLQRQLAPIMPSDAAEGTRQILAERDPIITALARNDPASASVLARTLVRYRELVHQSGLDSAGIVRPVR